MDSRISHFQTVIMPKVFCISCYPNSRIYFILLSSSSRYSSSPFCVFVLAVNKYIIMSSSQVFLKDVSFKKKTIRNKLKLKTDTNIVRLLNAWCIVCLRTRDCNCRNVLGPDTWVVCKRLHHKTTPSGRKKERKTSPLDKQSGLPKLHLDHPLSPVVYNWVSRTNPITYSRRRPPTETTDSCRNTVQINAVSLAATSCTRFDNT